MELVEAAADDVFVGFQIMDPLRLFARAQHVFGSPMQMRRTIPASATPQYRPSSRSAASGQSAVYSLGQALRRVIKWPAASPTPQPLSDPGCGYGYGPYLASRRLRAAGLQARRPGQYRAPCQCLSPSRSAVLFAQAALEDRPGLSVRDQAQRQLRAGRIRILASILRDAWQQVALGDPDALEPRARHGFGQCDLRAPKISDLGLGPAIASRRAARTSARMKVETVLLAL